MNEASLRCREKLLSALERSGSRLCIGIDPHRSFLDVSTAEGLLAWGLPLIETGARWCAAFKFNMAFFEALGADGWSALSHLVEAVPDDLLVILDGKRGDIGSTAAAYATSAFEILGADAVTVNPYMGTDAIEPFIYDGRLVFVLALTSNAGAKDFQLLCCDGAPLYEHVIRSLIATRWHDALGFVVGATHPDRLASVRQLVGPDVPLLIPGVGAQGGDLDAVCRANDGGVALVNVSRGLLQAYQDGGVAGFEEAAKWYYTQLAR